MADVPEKTIPEPAGKTNGLISPIMADVIGGVSSLIVGSLTAWQLITERAYKNMSSLHLFEPMKKERWEKGHQLAKQVIDGTISEADAGNKLKGMIDHYEEEAAKLMKGAGSGTILKKWDKLRGHQKAEVAITAAAYGGIALGSVLLLTRGIFSEQRQNLAKKGSPENAPEIQR